MELFIACFADVQRRRITVTRQLSPSSTWNWSPRFYGNFSGPCAIRVVYTVWCRRLILLPLLSLLSVLQGTSSSSSSSCSCRFRRVIPGMSNRGSPEGHMGHICVVMRATHDMRPTGRMFDMPDIEYVFFVQNVFLHMEIVYHISKCKKHTEWRKTYRFSVNDARLSSLNYKNCNFGR
jgi:hypothetical protein